MACGATLKRSIEFDPLYSPSQRSPKRRRCMPMTMSPVTPPTKQHQTNSPFGEMSPKLSTGQIAASIAMEIKRLAKRKQLQYTLSGDGTSIHTTSKSPPPMSTSPTPQSSLTTSTTVINSAADCRPSTSQNCSSSNLSHNKKDFPIFTFKQVSMFCERLLKEREEHIREEYNKILTTKLAEQYEAFLKFNHDQLHRRFGETAASYVS